MKAANDDLKAMIGKPGSFRLRVGNPQLSGSGASMIGVTDMVRFHGVNVQFHFRCQFAAIETVKNIKADNFVTVNGTISACGLTSETLLQISMKDCVLK